MKISEEAPIIVIEGDEYLSSRLDERPKFLHYNPHMLLISNISWDHINVFPDEKVYVEQFATLVKDLEKAASVIYFEGDERLKELVETHTNAEIHYLYPYDYPVFAIENEGFVLKIGEESGLMRVMGKHNMANIHAAWKVCELLSIEAGDFIKYMSSFEGAGIRLEKIKETENGLLIRDYGPMRLQRSWQA